jgi:uncharacterized protein (TIGR02246 family)
MNRKVRPKESSVVDTGGNKMKQQQLPRGVGAGPWGDGPPKRGRYSGVVGGNSHGITISLIGTAVILLAGQARADTAKEVERSVRAIQAAFNKGDVDTLKGLMTEDHVTTLTYARFANTADQLEVLSEFKFSEYKIDGLKVKALTNDVVLVSYQATIKGTYKGKEVPSPVQVTEVWVRRGGKWLQASYQETPLDRK